MVEHVVSSSHVFALNTVVGIGDDILAVVVGIGGVQRQEVGICRADGVGCGFQIVVHIKPTLALIEGCRIVLGVVIVIAVVFQLYNISNEPILDFRSWKVGNRMMPEQRGEVKTYLVYKNKTTGQTQEFPSENLMEYYKDTTWATQWEFVDSKIIDPNEIYADGFSMMGTDDIDYAKDIIGSADSLLIATIHHLNDVTPKGIASLQKVNKYAQDKGIYMVYLVSISSPAEEVEAFLAENQLDNAEYYYADEKAIETMLRSNPGFILLKDSEVLAKWHHSNSDDFIEE